MVKEGESKVEMEGWESKSNLGESLTFLSVCAVFAFLEMSRFDTSVPDSLLGMQVEDEKHESVLQPVILYPFKFSLLELITNSSPETFVTSSQGLYRINQAYYQLLFSLIIIPQCVPDFGNERKRRSRNFWDQGIGSDF